MIDYIAKVKQLSEKYPLLDFSNSIYAGAIGLMTAICPKHGEITKKGSHWNVNGCPQCGYEKMRSSTTDKTQGFRRTAALKKSAGEEKWNYFVTENSDWLDASMSVYKGTREKIQVRCKVHNYTYWTSIRTLTKQGSRCKFCGIEKLSDKAHTEEQNLMKARLVHGNKYEYIEVPHVIHDKAKILCPKHGEFLQSFHNHVQGMGCPRCTSGVSKGEQELYEYVKSLGVEVENRNRKIIAPKELDIYLPEHQLAIEYHGLHWHADDRDTTSLRDKYLMCKRVGVRVIQVFEDEWRDKSEVIKDLIAAAVGKRRSLMARKLTVASITKQESKQFLDMYHISGTTRAEHHYGLKNGDELVAVMTLGKPRFADADLEIIRFAMSHHIPGGFDKLFKFVLSQLSPTTVISYADLRFGHGETYVKSGFVDRGLTMPDYWWFKKQNRLTRYQTQKHRLSNNPEFAEFYSDDKTEAQICTEAGYRKISGVGHRKLIWSIINPQSPQPG